jgi:hypothetical protein
MTVKELIEELKKYDSEMAVYIEDSEYGAEESNSIEIRTEVWTWDGPNHFKQNVLVIK